MKIINLCFENLNSLKGPSPLIDFENGILADAGIFAITGATGAGKTTILDAICVALYGETPRLKVGRGGIGNLMSRHTGQCWSEVTFAVDGKYYRSRWSQRRAREKADGNIQTPRMELAILEGGDGDTLLAEKLSKVPGVVEELTGLNFKRFCRSMMLAQGEFAAFLDADENERAELLEKMTGTEIYAEISSRVFERNKAEHQALEELKKSIDAMDLMSEEELTSLGQRLKDVEEKLASIALETEKVRGEKKWLEEIASQEGIIEKSRADIASVQREMEDSAQSLGRLKEDARAQKIITEFSLLEKTRSGCIAMEKKRAALDVEIPRLKAKLENKQNLLELKKRQYDEFLAEKEELEAIIPQVIKIDEDIRGRKKTVAQAHGQRKLLDERIGKIRADGLGTTRILDDLKKSESECSRYLSEHECDAVLSDGFSLLESRLLELPGIHASIAGKKKEQALCVQANKRTDADLKKNRVSLEAAAKELQNLQDEKKGLRLEFEQRAGKKSLDEWEGLEKSLGQRGVTLQRLMDIEQAIGTIRAELKSMVLEKTRLCEESGHLAKAEKKAALDAGELEVDIADLRQKRELELKIRDYEKDRSELKTGQACPLCGAIDHPFVKGIPEIRATETRIGKKEAALGRKNRELLSLGKKIAALGERIIGLEKNHADRKAAGQKYRIEREGLLKDGGKVHDSTVHDSMDEELKRCQTGLKECEEVVSGLKLINKRTDAAIKKESRAERTLSDKRLEKSECESKFKAGSVKLNGLEDDIKKTGADLAALEKELAEKLTPLELTLPDKGGERLCVKQLFEKKSSYEDHVKRRQSCEKNKAAAEKTLEALDGQMVEALKAKDMGRDAFESIERSMICRVDEREKLFGNKDPEAVAAQLKKDDTKFGREMDPMTKDVHDLEKELGTNKALSLDWTKELKQLGHELAGMEEEFLLKLETEGFENETSFKGALLPEDELKILESLKEDMEKRFGRANTRLKDALKKVSLEREKALTKKEMVLVDDEIATFSQKKSAHDQELGKVLNILGEQERLRGKQGERLVQIRAHEKECYKWRLMNELIGSSDGKAFRKFAQGLTLEYLIRDANRYLESFGDRYLIQVVAEQDLGIEIVDLYQSDAVRPVNTLSGGESFLVSLALALGLSMLSSRRTKVESLFLDEGFGTLDNETLYVALQALHSIHASGKIIGIISHVDALKEQIPVQLQVKKRSGGVSEVVIAG